MNFWVLRCHPFVFFGDWSIHRLDRSSVQLSPCWLPVLLILIFNFLVTSTGIFLLHKCSREKWTHFTTQLGSLHVISGRSGTWPFDVFKSDMYIFMTTSISSNWSETIYQLVQVQQIHRQILKLVGTTMTVTALQRCFRLFLLECHVIAACGPQWMALSYLKCRS